ncbi:hypothetical protein P8452_44856 [Trifolium repens]|nr:hypothetical protein P8452_44856 [Trifolium repens]
MEEDVGEESKKNFRRVFSEEDKLVILKGEISADRIQINLLYRILQRVYLMLRIIWEELHQFDREKTLRGKIFASRSCNSASGSWCNPSKKILQSSRMMETIV